MVNDCIDDSIGEYLDDIISIVQVRHKVPLILSIDPIEVVEACIPVADAKEY